LFNTIAHNAGMSIVEAPQLSTILWRREWKPEEFTKDYLFHPVKDMDEQQAVWDRFMAEEHP